MKSASKGQVYSVGNYLMTGKVLGKGHFARVEEATHRIIGKKVAIKIIDLTCIKEEYARRNLHREPTVMSRLRHPCIAALYETMMHGPRLYVVMEAACGGDLCALVLGARAGPRGLPEGRARALATQLVSAVRHMHARGVVHRDLKMENIMLDSSKTFIKIVDFGLSNVWRSGGGLHTPCGSLEYAAPELFRETRRYGPELDLWSIGVIVYGMVTGSLPFVSSGTGVDAEGRSRPQLRAAIAKGFGKKHRAALVAFSPECRAFIQQLLETNVESRMKIDEAAKHRWLKRPGMKMRSHPFGELEPKVNREIYKQISEQCGLDLTEVMTQIKSDPYGPIAGMYNIKAHLTQLNSLLLSDPLWSSAIDARPPTPPEYKPQKTPPIAENPIEKMEKHDGVSPVRPKYSKLDSIPKRPSTTPERPKVDKVESRLPQPCNAVVRPPRSKPIYKVCENGDCLDPRLPMIAEHRKLEGSKPHTAEPNRTLRSCLGKDRTSDFYKRAGDATPKYENWRAQTNGTCKPLTRILLQSNATSIKRASLGNITSPHSSTHSYCKSERAAPAGWYSNRSVNKEPLAPSLQRLRRTAPIK